MRRATFIAFLCTAISLASLTVAQGPSVDLHGTVKGSASPNLQRKEIAPQLTKDDLAAFLDGLVPPQLQENDIAGAVICVVKDGKTIFAKGYGYSDVAKRKQVAVDATLFRPGSISKTFTWTAVMQMVEQGKIDLDRDVNDYLDFTIPAKFGKPVTMRTIMTHTTGFEEALKDLFLNNA